MGSIMPIYLDKDWQTNYEEKFKRFIKANGGNKNQAVLTILKIWLDSNQRYTDRKITDFEVERKLESKPKETEVVCKECGALQTDTDSKGFVIHDKGCSWNRNIIR